MSKTIKTIFKLRRGTSDWYKTNNPKLAEGEPAYELDTRRLKIGNGTLPYNSLKYTNENLVNIETMGLDGSYYDSYFLIPPRLRYGSNAVTWADLINHPFFNPIANASGIRFFSLDDYNYVMAWNYSYEDYCYLRHEGQALPKNSIIDINKVYHVDTPGCEDSGCEDLPCEDSGCEDICNDYSCEDAPSDPDFSGEYDTMYITARTTMGRLGPDGIQIKNIIPEYFDPEDSGNPLMLCYQINVPDNITTWEQLIDNDDYNPTGETLDDNLPIFKIDIDTDMVQAYDGKSHRYREIILLSNRNPYTCNGAPVYSTDSLMHKNTEIKEDFETARPGYYYRYAPILTCEDAVYYCEDDFTDCGDTYLY